MAPSGLLGRWVGGGGKESNREERVVGVRAQTGTHDAETRRRAVSQRTHKRSPLSAGTNERSRIGQIDRQTDKGDDDDDDYSTAAEAGE